MVVMALRTDGNQRYNWMKNRRSLFVNWTRPRIFRCSTISCCLNAAFSASSRLLDLKIEPPRLKRKNMSVAIAADVKRFYQQTKWTTFLFEAELYRLKARALLMRGAPDAEAETLLDQALRTARTNRRDRSNFARQPPEKIEAARASSDGGEAERRGGSSAGKQLDAGQRLRPAGRP